MSSGDKTRQKLMESMRKTKAGAGKKTVETDSKTTNKPVEEMKAEKKAKKVDTKKAAKPSLQPGVDSYQSGRRIWPD